LPRASVGNTIYTFSSGCTVKAATATFVEHVFAFGFITVAIVFIAIIVLTIVVIVLTIVVFIIVTATAGLVGEHEVYTGIGTAETAMPRQTMQRVSTCYEIDHTRVQERPYPSCCPVSTAAERR